MADQDIPMPPPPMVAPGPDESRIGDMLAPVILMLVITTTLIIMRLYSRIRPVMNLGMEDATAVLAVIASAMQIAFLFAAIPLGLGRHNFYVENFDDQILAAKYILVSQFPWGWGVAFSKVSIGLLLLRFKTTVRWRIFLWAMIAIPIILAAVANIVQLVQCKPIAASWDPTILGAECWDPVIAQKGVYVMGSLSVATDVVLALIPISFLRELQRPIREKAVLAFLMGLGLFTGAAVIVKMTVVGNFGNSMDPLWDVIDLATWSIVEAQMGIVACCVPCLKAPFESILRRVGLLSKRTNTNTGYINANSASRSRAYYMQNMSAANRTRAEDKDKAITNFSPAASESSILPQATAKDAY